MMHRTAWILTAGLLGLIPSGCTVVGPDYVAPEARSPEAWQESSRATFTAEHAALAAWWNHFQDPTLTQLIERASARNLDVRRSLIRIDEARSQLGIAEADLFPTLSHALSFQRRGESRNTVFGAFSPDANTWSAGFDATWELDLWGRVRRSIEAKEAEFEASIEDVRDVWVMVAAETARHYVVLRASQARLEVARANVRLQEETQTLVQARFDSGLVSERDLAQAKSQVAATKSRVPALEVMAREAENRLCVLVGSPPGELGGVLGGPASIPVPPAQVAVGVPADLLRRRADLRRLERELAAETARIGMAEAELYPTITLTGSLGVAAEDAGDLTDRGSGTFTFGPSLRWNLFDSGRLRRRVEAQEARTEQAWLRWEAGVLTALEEAENAMTALVQEQLRRQDLLTAASEARRAVTLAEAQYAEGLSDFQSVVDSQRRVAELEDQQAESEAAVVLHLIRWFKALGGVWDGGVDPTKTA